MKLISFRTREGEGWGVAEPDCVAEFTSPEYPTLREALERRSVDELLALAPRKACRIPFDQIQYLPPITNPEKIIGVGINYRAHGDEVDRDVPTHPALFVRFPSAQVGHLVPIVQPYQSEAFNFEGELAVVIGRRARHVIPAEALSYIAGYSCFADK